MQAILPAIATDEDDVALVLDVSDVLDVALVLDVGDVLDVALVLDVSDAVAVPAVELVLLELGDGVPAMHHTHPSAHTVGRTHMLLTQLNTHCIVSPATVSNLQHFT
jgi:hypothetical protein